MIIETVFLFAWGVALLITGIQASKAKPPKEIMAKYRKAMLLYHLIPFASRWQDQIAPSDLPFFEQYRIRNSRYRATIFIPQIIFYAYLYFRYLHPFL